MKVVISSFGSSGDFNPCLAIARSLRDKGVDVIFLSNPFYEKVIKDAGLRFWRAGEYFDVFNEIQSNPVYLHPRKGPGAVWKLVLKIVPETFYAMKELVAAEKPDAAVCHLLEYGGMLGAHDCKIPYIILSPNPMCWVNTVNPGYFTFKKQSVWLRRLEARFMSVVMSGAFKYSLVPNCQKNGFTSPIKSLGELYEKAQADLGLWSESLRPRRVGDPENTRICGFVRDEHIKDWEDVPTEIQRLFKLDRKPVVAGLGSTASLHGEEVYARTAKACKELGRPCLLVGKGLSKHSTPEANILAVDFAPYGWVFPRAGAVIHHGGLNTTAETLRSGAASLVIPHGYDQFDNAIRAELMGVSKNINLGKVGSDKFASALCEVLNDSAMHEKAIEISKQICAEPEGANAAAEAIVSVVG